MKKVTQFLTVIVIVSGVVLLDSAELKAQSVEKNSSKNTPVTVNTKTITLEIKGMSCQIGCADGLDESFKGMKGIIQSNTSFDNSSSEIIYDKSRVSKKEIVKMIQDRGFKTKELKDKL